MSPKENISYTYIHMIHTNSIHTLKQITLKLKKIIFVKKYKLNIHVEADAQDERNLQISHLTMEDRFNTEKLYCSNYGKRAGLIVDDCIKSIFDIKKIKQRQGAREHTEKY